MKVIVLHEYGAPSHYSGLAFHARQQSWLIEYRELTFVKQILKGLYRRDMQLFARGFQNLCFLAKTLMLRPKHQHYVVGIAPFDLRVAYILCLRGSLHWHNSWSSWDAEAHDFPKHKNRLSQWLWHQFWNRLQSAFFVSESSRTNFKSAHKVEFPISVVNHAVDSSIFHASDRPINPKRRPTVGICGRLEVSKGLQTFLEIAKAYPSDYDFVIIGEGSMKSQAEEAARQHPGRINYHPKLAPTELADRFRQMDYLLMPSMRTSGWEEAFGLVIVESMACGVIPVTTDHPGPVEILRHELKSLIFPELNFKDNAMRLISALEANAAAKSNLRKKIRERALDYTVERISQKWRF